MTNWSQSRVEYTTFTLYPSQIKKINDLAQDMRLSRSLLVRLAIEFATTGGMLDAFKSWAEHNLMANKIR